MNKIFTSILCIFLISCSSNNFNSERKEATEYTKKENEKLKNYLPFDDNTDFENAKRGFIETSDDNISFPFISNQPAPDTVNPSLWRQAQLNNISGLFEVTPDIYQVRGFDLANITFVRGYTGWIVIDVLTTKESASKAIELFRKYKGNDPITGVIFTHSHVDHFGGIRGVIENSNIPIVAPEGFFEEAVSENLLAGNAMSRRSSYMYGGLLPKDEKGTVDAGLGKLVATGTPGIIRPNKIISKDYESYTIDGIEFQFLMAQNTEAPAEFMIYIPKYRAASSAEVMNHTLHNLSTLRGAKTRDSLIWTKAIEKSKEFLKDRTDVLFGSHHWPIWEQSNIDDFLNKHGDLYKYIHDQTLRYANMGYTPIEIAEKIQIPDNLAKEFYNRGYYGSVNHDVKAVYDFYFGAWWDGNPANLYKLPPEESAKRYVEFMGGEDNIIKMAKKSYDEGDYRWVIEVLNNVIFANPNNENARKLSADAMEQLGYQSESAVWRAYLLTGAYELRNEIDQNMKAPQTTSLDMINALSAENMFEYISVALNPDKVKDKNISVLFNITDDNKYLIKIENSVLKYKKYNNENTDYTIDINMSDFKKALFTKKADDLNINNKDAFNEFLSYFDTFNYWFNIVTP
ncbi:MBL fold metallo-hydrolase [Brachyspira hyodysenteriae]|uniref:alkyl/aryl-sulfatase n=1 Tax=Brachyspira hyodysenteriae TaxID=159 RepID=UPI0022CD25BF|nr:alkyl sulfatase dimerization domain-containing protein [Brachyspira hyodysenteriae]MDA0035740.1 MBL fold metallo-hydrolase [Brachyspira hyodysenteriae]MDA0049827.1 MBL fold metallo-hydrolase [Brachyspira hyodysenteriae]MDA1467734.1 MBL fold metallo-hydrolase [Brachyspira hyodysenteriae]